MIKNGNAAIKAIGLTYVYGSLVAVKDTSLTVYPGEVVAVTGANGAGKTTLMKMLCGILTPCSGDVFIAGHNIVSDGKKGRGALGYMSQSTALLNNLTARENFNFYAIAKGLSTKKREDKFLGSCDEFNLNLFKDKRVEHLTAGWRQLLSFSIAVMNDPPVLLLDEPTAGLDSVTRGKIWKHITRMSDSGSAVVVTSHYKLEAEICGREILIRRPCQ